MSPAPASHDDPEDRTGPGGGTGSGSGTGSGTGGSFPGTGPGAQAEPITRVGKYHVLSEIGAGAMGVVYRAFDTEIQREVAIKTIRPELLAGDPEEAEEWRARFEREVRAAARCLHANVVTIFDFGTAEGVPYIVMEFCPGRPLDKVLRAEAPMDLARVLRIAAQVLGALDMAHEKGIVHRDVKPANVLLLDGDRVKVTDFGIARIENAQLTRGPSDIGTPAYMAPEQFEAGAIDRRTDLFCFAAMLFEMLAGRRPFPGRRYEEIRQKVLNEPPLDLRLLRPEVPEPIIAAVEQALARDPAARPVSAAALASMLREGLLDPAAPRPAPPEPPAADLEETVVQPPEEGRSARTGRTAGTAPGTASGTVWGRTPPPQSPQTPEPPRRWPARALGLALAAAAAVAAWIYLPGVMERMTGPDLPVAAPYAFDLAVEGRRARYSGNAPSEEEAAALGRELSRLLSAEGVRADGTLEPAAGVPEDLPWAETVAALLAATADLEGLRLRLRDDRASVSGEAGDAAERAAVEERLAAVATRLGLDYDLEATLAPPAPLSHATVRRALAPVTGCGPVGIAAPDPLGPDAAVRLSGWAVDAAARTALIEAAGLVAEGREVRADIAVMNPSVCQIADLLRETGSERVAFRLSDGGTRTVADGVFRTGENPVTDVLIDDSLSQQYLHVFFVDPGGKVLRLLPHLNRQEHRIDRAGRQEPDERWRVRITFPKDERSPARIAPVVGAPYGNNGLFAVVTPRPFFDTLQAREGSVDFMAEDVTAALIGALDQPVTAERTLVVSRAE